MKRITDLMRIDVMGIYGKRKSGLKAAAVFLILAGASLLLFTSFVSAGVMLIAYLSVAMVADNELKKEYGKTFSIVPADRKSVVIARFMLMTLITTAAAIILYVFMTVLSKAGFYDLLWSGGFEPENSDDTLSLIDSVLFDPRVAKMIFAFGFMLALIIMSVKLRKLFRNGAVKPTAKKNLTRIIRYVLIFLGFEALMGIIFLTPLFVFFKAAFLVIMRFISAIAQPMGGALLVLIFVLCGYAAVLYNGICAYIEYDKREL